MTPEQITLVQESFAKVAPIADHAAIMFYDRLFELARQVKTLFPADMTERRRKLMAMLACAVNGLANLQSVLPAAGALAKRHIAYGAKPEDYPIVGAALLWTLEKGLGDVWTAETAEALGCGLWRARLRDDRTGVWPPTRRRTAVMTACGRFC
jgi:hemoglobin-like flavoprotein